LKFDTRLFAGKTYAQSQPDIISAVAAHRAIRGIAAADKRRLVENFTALSTRPLARAYRSIKTCNQRAGGAFEGFALAIR